MEPAVIEPMKVEVLPAVLQDPRRHPRKAVKCTAQVAEVAEPKKSKERQETLEQREAFRVFMDLGESRTNAGVAEALGIALWKVNRWSHQLKWQDRIKTEQSRTLQEKTITNLDTFFHRQSELLLMRQNECFDPDPDNPGKFKFNNDKGSINALKETTTAALNVLKGIAEKVGIKTAEKELDKDPGGNGQGKSKGVMVNVIFQGIESNG